MLRLLLTGILMTCAFMVKAQEVPDAGKLQGTWQLIGDTTRYEQWRQGDSVLLAGRSFKVEANGDTSIWEQLTIYQKSGQWYYQATVSGNAPVDFKLVTCTSTIWTFTNPEHDFPQEITYLFQADAMKVTISGGGKPQEFVFQKVR